MADIFLQEDVEGLLQRKKLLFVGDSNARALYKDCLCLLHSDSLIENSVLRRKLECSFLGDKLVKKSELTKGRDFVEHRAFKGKGVNMEFLFITQCISKNLLDILEEIRNGRMLAPNVVIINSCLWDLTRWGPEGASDYRQNMVKLVELLKVSLPKLTMVIWATTPPTAAVMTGGLIIKQIEFMQEIVRYELLAANKFAADLMIQNGFDVIDFHFYLQSQIFRRSCDGVHYLPHPVRLMTNLLLTHICLSWGHPLPGNLNNSILDSVLEKVNSELEKVPDAVVDALPISNNEKGQLGRSKKEKRKAAPNNVPILNRNPISKNKKKRNRRNKKFRNFKRDQYQCNPPFWLDYF